MIKIETIRFIDILAGVVVISCLFLLYLGRDGKIIYTLVGVLTAYGLFKVPSPLGPKK